MRHNLRLLLAVLFAMSGASVLMNLRKMLHLYSCNDQPKPTENKQNIQKIADNKNRTLLQVLWPVLGGFKGTPFNDLEQVEHFFKDRPIKWKVVLRVGNENVLAWRDGWKHLTRIKCPVTKCLFTRNATEFDTADALVLTHFADKEHSLFNPKPKHQVWIAQTLEPPYHLRLNATLLRGLVNWTATYRRDSTIVLPYGLWIKSDPPLELEPPPTKKNYARGKTKKVAMFVSNCKDISGRINYAVELNRTISVDIYGKCGSLKCDRFKNSSACAQMLRKDYKFYLSFENSNCIDYITEKLHVNALSNDIVPVVMGARREDYVAAAPPHSFVHVDDFLSPGHLGKYLNLLDSNDALYNEYFHYKGRYRLLGLYELGTSYWCQLCARLHMADHGGVVTWVEDYDKWWNGASCITKGHRNNTWRTWKSPGS